MGIIPQASSYQCIILVCFKILAEALPSLLEAVLCSLLSREVMWHGAVVIVSARGHLSPWGPCTELVLFVFLLYDTAINTDC